MSDEKKVMDIEHEAMDNNGNFDRSWRDEMWGDRKLSVAAEETAKDEKDFTTWEAIQASKKAILWSLVISTCVIMEGYDTNLLGNCEYKSRELDPGLTENQSMLIPPSKRNMATRSRSLSKLPLVTRSQLDGNLVSDKEVGVVPSWVRLSTAGSSRHSVLRRLCSALSVS